ncbi:MAG: condensation domain-containing protein [Pseudomonadota bacterium]
MRRAPCRRLRAMSHRGHAAGPERFPLPGRQSRILAMLDREPDGRHPVLAQRWHVSGRVRTDVLERAFQGVIARHESLRTRFGRSARGWRRQVYPDVEFKLVLFDIRALPLDDHAARIDRIADETAVEPFDLAKPPLLRVAHVRTAAEAATLLITVHSAVFDEASLDVLSREVFACATAELDGRVADLVSLPTAREDRLDLGLGLGEGPSGAANGALWERALSGAQRFTLPGDLDGSGGPLARQTLTLPPGFDRRFASAARRRAMSPFALGTAAAAAALSRATGKTGIVLATPVDGRTTPDLSSLIGPIGGAVVLRLSTWGTGTIDTHITRANRAIRAALKHQVSLAEHPGDRERPELAPHPSRLTDVGFSVRHVASDVLKTGAFQLTVHPPREVGYALAVNMTLLGRSGAWALIFDYDSQRYSPAFIARLGRLFLDALDQAIEGGKAHVGHLAGPASSLVRRSEREYSLPIAGRRGITRRANDPRSDARLADTAPRATWQIDTLKTGVAGGPVVVFINPPLALQSTALRFETDCTVATLSVPDRAAHERQIEIGYDALIEDAVGALAGAFPRRGLALLGQGIDGVAALHLARRLEKRGLTLLPTGLVDTWAPLRPEPLLAGLLDGGLLRVPRANRNTRASLDSHLRPRWAAGLARFLGGVARAAGVHSGRQNGDMLMRDVRHHHRSAARQFPFGLWHGEVVFFATDGQPRRAVRTLFNWYGILAPDTPIYRVPAPRDDAARDRCYADVAEIFDARVGRALARSPSGSPDRPQGRANR